MKVDAVEKEYSVLLHTKDDKTYNIKRSASSPDALMHKLRNTWAIEVEEGIYIITDSIKLIRIQI